MKTVNEFANNFSELMNKFDEYKEKWIKENGTIDGYNEWFTAQVFGSTATN